MNLKKYIRLKERGLDVSIDKKTNNENIGLLGFHFIFDAGIFDVSTRSDDVV